MTRLRLYQIPPLFALLLCALPASATTVLPVSLDYMAGKAQVIFQGRAAANETVIDEASGQIATYTTFEVIETIKGDVGTEHTIKQIGGSLPDRKRRQVIHGVPRFAVGREYILFLPQPSALGFSSPIGLYQGNFTVTSNGGRPTVGNGRSMASLMAPADAGEADRLPRAVRISAPATVPGRPHRAYLDSFVQTVRGMTGE